MVKLPAMKNGGPYRMTVKGKTSNPGKRDDRRSLGLFRQSNMEFNLITSKNGEADVAASNYPDIRLFTVKRRISQTPQDQLEEGEWTECSPATSHHFSAVAYFFGKALYEKLKVPIGLIHTSWGGTVAETWISDETMAQNPDFASQLSQLKTINLDDYAKTIEKEVRERVGNFRLLIWE